MRSCGRETELTSCRLVPVHGFVVVVHFLAVRSVEARHGRRPTRLRSDVRRPAVSIHACTRTRAARRPGEIAPLRRRGLPQGREPRTPPPGAIGAPGRRSNVQRDRGPSLGYLSDLLHQFTTEHGIQRVSLE